MSERKSFIEIYGEASMGKRVNIILDNFPYFNRIVDSYENCIRDKICDERSSNARSSYGECGIRVQTSGFSDITCNTAIKNEEIDRALLNDDYKTAVEGTDDRFKYQRELEIIRGMRIDYEKVKEACGMLPGKDYAFYMNYLSGKKDTVQIAEEGLVELLEALKNKGIKIGIGTNMTAFVQFEKIRALGISQYVDCMVTSEEAAAEKPTKPFFDYALGKLGISCDECVFIGDDAKNDMQGAKGAGMIPVWYTPHAGEADRRLIEELKVTDRIDNYRECILSDGGIRLGSVRI